MEVKHKQDKKTQSGQEMKSHERLKQLEIKQNGKVKEIFKSYTSTSWNQKEDKTHTHFMWFYPWRRKMDLISLIHCLNLVKKPSLVPDWIMFKISNEILKHQNRWLA